MPAHQRTKSGQRASSLPPSSSPLAFRQSNAARERARRTPIVPSARRKHTLETLAETSASRHLQAALALLPTNGGPRRSSAPSKLGSPFALRPSKPAASRMTIKEENEEDMFIDHNPDAYEACGETLYDSLQARAFDWKQDPFEDSPVFVHGQRPNYKHKHKRSSSYAAMSSLHPPARTLQPTLLSATPSPHISASNSPVPSPRMLDSDLDFSLLLSPSIPHGWPGTRGFGSASPSFLSTPSFSTPGLSPSASSTSGSPFVPGYNDDYFALQSPRTRQTPGTPRPVPY